MTENLFQVSRCGEMYHACPTSLYLEKYKYDLLNKICPKYSYGAKNSFAVCDIYISKNNVTLKRFDNYVLKYCYNEKKLYETPYKGLALILLKSIIINELNKDNITLETEFIVVNVNKENEKLVKYYQSISFVDSDGRSMHSNIKDFLKITENIDLIECIYTN